MSTPCGGVTSEGAPFGFQHVHFDVRYWPSRHFAAALQFGGFRSEADINSASSRMLNEYTPF